MTIATRIYTQTEERIAGHTVGYQYRIFQATQHVEIVCRSLNNNPNDTDHLRTIETYYPVGNQFCGRLKSRRNFDGTMVFYTYVLNADGSLTTTETSGEPNANGDAIQNGRKILSLTDKYGYVQSIQTFDITGGQNGITLSTESRSCDQLGRATNITYLDGTQIDRVYSCCALDSETDREGTTTYFVYDDLKRLIGKVRNSITTIYSYDAAGHQTQVWRQGTNGSSILQNGYAYDTSGRLTYETNALGGVASYTYGWTNGQPFKTTTSLTSGGTVIETYFLDGYLDRVIGTATKPYRLQKDVIYDGSFWSPTTREIKLKDAAQSYADSSEWVETRLDLTGKSGKTVYAVAQGQNNPTATRTYNNKGQLIKEVEPDNVTRIYQYNGKGELEYSVLNLSQNGTIDWTGADRITRTTNSFGSNGTADVKRTETYVFHTNSATPLLISTVEISTDGKKTWQITKNGNDSPTTLTQIGYYRPTGYRYETNTAPDGAKTIGIYQYGLLKSVTRKDSANNQLSQVTYTYDPHGRLLTATDARTGATTYGYNNADLIQSVVSPAPGTGQPAQTTITYYDGLGQPTGTIYPDGTSLTNVYYPTGQLNYSGGSRTYPVGYGYDSQGRMIIMTNWTAYAGNGSGTGTRVTTWSYNTTSGYLSGKADDNGQGAAYEYTAAGRLSKRTWARGTPSIYTSYTYNNAGDLATITYNADPNGTPNVTYTYDRRGRLSTVTRNSITTTLGYNDASELVSETYAGGTLAGLLVTNQYDTLLRRSQVQGLNGATVLATATYGYEANSSRLQTVSDGTYSAAYSYVANSSLIGQITYKQNTTAKMTTTKQYDNLNRLQSISSAGTTGLPLSFGYLYNDANQRTRVNLADGSYWIYTYDTLGQVTSGKKYWQDNTPVPGQQFEYAHDDIGNRAQTKAGGDQNGQNLRQAGYTANNLNQYSSRVVPGTLDIIGIAISTNSVSVNSASAAYRRGEYYWSLLTVGNGSSPVWQMVTNTSGGSSVVGGALVPPNSQTMQYDLDGNLTNDLVWNYTWDAENRLIRMTNASTLTASNRLQLAFEYDWKGRRIRKTVTRLDTSTVILDNKFLYDGWNLIAELNATNNNVIRNYVWGTDLSGTMQGAGGVGGLLKMANYIPSVTNYFVAYDGNGNVAGLIHADLGTNMVTLEYGPFGEPIRNSGAWNTAAKTCPIRFSSKYNDDETDFVYYGYRYYNPSTGRWLNRDPIGEKGGANIYSFNENAAVNHIDLFGNEDYSTTSPKQYIGSLDMFLSFWLGTGPNGGLSQRMIDEVINSSPVQSFKDGLLADGKTYWKCGKHNEFMRFLYLPDFNPKINMSWFSASGLDWFLTGNWQLFLKGYCKVNCQSCDPICRCKCDTKCTINGIINKLYTFVDVGGNNANKFTTIPAVLLPTQTYLIEETFTIPGLDVGYRPCPNSW